MTASSPPAAKPRIGKLRLLSLPFRLVLLATLLAALLTLAVSELTVPSAREYEEAITGALESDNRAELHAIQREQLSSTRWSRLALAGSTVVVVILLLAILRLAIDQAAADDRRRRASIDDADRMQATIAARTAELAQLSSHLQVAIEKEKADLARNLHDEMGGLLTAARMDLSWLQGAVGEDPAVQAKLQQLSDSLSQAMDVKRRVVESLRPALLDHFGLPTALQHHFEENCRKAGLDCTTLVPEELAELPDDVAIALFRVGQESLTNILRHANARNVHLEIAGEAAGLTLSIRDDGIGMDSAAAAHANSHGLSGMRHRITALGGTFDLASTPGRGTTIRIRLPARGTPGGPPRSAA